MSKKKILTLVLALALVATCAIGGTVAWLIDAPEKGITNTFTMGDIDIKLMNETTEITSTQNEIASHFVPGQVFTDAKYSVIVEENSEDCYVFIKFIVENNTVSKKNILTYELDGWTALDGYSGFYYKEYTKNTSDQTLNIIKESKITVNSALERNEVFGVNSNKPTITIAAAAIQKDYVGNSAVEAFKKLPQAFTNISAE